MSSKVIGASPAQSNEASCRPATTDWFSEYMHALSARGELRAALSFIEGYTRTALQYPDPTNWRTHLTQLHARAQAALDATQDKPSCDNCGEDIEPAQLDAATQVPPDYMPESFRKRATVILCEQCRGEH